MAEDSLRTPFFLAALIVFAIVVLIELGASAILPGSASADALQAVVGDQCKPPDPALTGDQCTPGSTENIKLIAHLRQLNADHPRPGLGIPYLPVLDIVVLFTVALMGAGLVLPQSIQGRLQGLGTLIFSIIIIIVALVLIFAAIGLVMLMISLLLSVPFGTLAYLAIYGFFNRGGASATLSLITLLKLAFAVCLILAQQRFLQNKGLVLLVLTSLVADLIVAFLQGLVPIFLVSITDAIAGIIVAILAVIWAVFLLIGSIPAVVRALKPTG